MGVITLALIANGNLAKDASVPAWVVVSAATAISLGTYIGGWRIIRTLGHGITKLETPQGFGAETSSAVVILAASQAGYPLSTTHVTSGGVMGAGVGKRAAEVNWTTAQQMAFAWLVTIPAAGLIAGAFYLLVDGLGTDIAGPLRGQRARRASPRPCCSSPRNARTPSPRRTSDARRDRRLGRARKGRRLLVRRGARAHGPLHHRRPARRGRDGHRASTASRAVGTPRSRSARGSWRSGCT